jgi:pyruvate/2-oxoglutarate dehydrogenase complex dihydrolipoamide acyltransferase (E2) component
MTTEIILPKWGLTMEEGTVGAWMKQEGDAVNEGDVLAEVETDKVNNELPSPVAGVLVKILVPEGETVPVGAVLALIEASA